MTVMRNAAALALSTMIVTPACAFTGVGGCSGLPEYYRALGALQGNMQSACDMSVDQARRILQAYGEVPSSPSTLTPHRAHRRDRPETAQP